MKNQAEKYYSKTDVAEYFGMPESTIRFYCERFAPYLEHVGQGRKRRYAASSLEVIDFIRTKMPDVRTSREMDAVLAARFPVVAEAPAKSKKAPAQPASAALDSSGKAALQLLERQASALERIAASLERLEAQPASPTGDANLEDLRSEIRDLRVLVKTTEKTQAEDMEQVRGLIMRLARGK